VWLGLAVGTNLCHSDVTESPRLSFAGSLFTSRFLYLSSACYSFTVDLPGVGPKLSECGRFCNRFCKPRRETRASDRLGWPSQILQLSRGRLRRSLSPFGFVIFTFTTLDFLPSQFLGRWQLYRLSSKAIVSSEVASTQQRPIFYVSRPKFTNNAALWHSCG